MEDNPHTHTKQIRVRCQTVGRAGTNRSQAAQPDAEERPHTYGFELFGSTSEEQAAASLPSDTGDPSSSLLLETTLGSIRNDFDCRDSIAKSVIKPVETPYPGIMHQRKKLRRR